MPYQNYIAFLVGVFDKFIPLQLVYPVKNQLCHHRMVTKWFCYNQLEVLLSAYLGTLLDCVLKFHPWIEKAWHDGDRACPALHATADSLGNKWRQYLKETVANIIIISYTLYQTADLFKLLPHVWLPASSVYYQKRLLQYFICTH